MTTSKDLRNSLQNLLDYFASSDLVLNVSAIREVGGSTPATIRLTFAQAREDLPFLLSANHPGVDQYLDWVRNNSYSMLLLDGSIVQMAYDLDTRRGKVIAHRLAYVPCPYDIDLEELAVFPTADMVEEYRGSAEVAMRSPVRFDYDPAAAKKGHPAAHMTLNGVDCRIACVAPMHPYSFIDFVFRNFYPGLWSFHRTFFANAAGRHLAHDVGEVEQPEAPHVIWRGQMALER